MRTRSPVLYNFVNDQEDVGMNNNGPRMNYNPNEQVVPEEDPSEYSGGGDANGDLPNGH